MLEFKNSEKGMGIVEVLIASGFMLFFIQFLSQSFINFKNFQKYDGMELTNDHLADYISDSADCFTITPNVDTCNDGDIVQIQTTSGIELTNNKKQPIKKTARLGNYRLRAFCKKCPDSCPDVDGDGRRVAGDGVEKGEGNVIKGGVYIDVQAIRIIPEDDWDKPAKNPMRRDKDEQWTSLFYSDEKGGSRRLRLFRCGQVNRP